MTEIAKPAGAGKWEVVRRLRYGALMKLFRHRYGYQFPDDDAGREDLLVLLCVVSLAQSGADQKMANVIEMWAPWLHADEAAEYLDRINRLTIYDRMPTARALGIVLNLTNAERERLRLWPIKPTDMTDEELTAQRKIKERERQKLRRRSNGAAPKRVAARPWEAEGIARSTWYRRRRNETQKHAHETPAYATILHKQRTKVSHCPKRPARKCRDLSPEQATGVRAGESQKASSSPDVRTFESHDERLAALNNWGENAKRRVEKNSTLAPENNARGWNDLSDFDAYLAFPEQLPWCSIEAIGPFAVAFGPGGEPCGERGA
jgi:hypothetical protein